MNVTISYSKNDTGITFDQIKDKECFFSGGVLYMKIQHSDLKSYGIDCVNAISILNAGLTFFHPDELVCRAERTCEMARQRREKLHQQASN